MEGGNRRRHRRSLHTRTHAGRHVRRRRRSRIRANADRAVLPHRTDPRMQRDVHPFDNAGTDPRIAAAFAASPSLTKISDRRGHAHRHASTTPPHWADELLPLVDAVAAAVHAAARRARRSSTRTGAFRAGRVAAPTALATWPASSTRRPRPTLRSAASRSSASRAPTPRSPSGRGRARSTTRHVPCAAPPCGCSPNAGRSETRDLLERALADGDACVRYYAVRGLYAIGPSASIAALHHRRADTDPRVKIAAEAATEGRPPS